jgi:hypothetical protein
MQNIEIRALVFRPDFSKHTNASRPPAGVVNLRAQEIPSARSGFLIQREDVYFMARRYHALDEPQQTRDHAVRAAAVHSSRNQKSDFQS